MGSTVDSKDVIEGGNLTVVCNVSDQGQVYWTRNGITVTFNKTLNIPFVTRTLSGLYTCMAYNNSNVEDKIRQNLQQEIYTFFLNVLCKYFYIHQLGNTEYNGNRGSLLTTFCLNQSTDFKVAKFLTSASTILVRHSGYKNVFVTFRLFTCIDPAKIISVNVNTTTLHEQDDFIMQVTVEGNPYPSTRFKSLDDGTTWFLKEKSEGSFEITIPSVNCTNTGLYELTCTNGLANKSVIENITVLCKLHWLNL